MRKKKIYTFDEGYEIIEKLLGYTKDEVEAFLLNSGLMWFSKKTKECYPYTRYCRSLDEDDVVKKHKYFYIKIDGKQCEYGFTYVGIKYVVNNISKKHFL